MSKITLLSEKSVGQVKVYKVTAGIGDNAQVVLGAAGTYEVATIPAGFVVTKVMARTVTAFTSGSRISFSGYGGSPFYSASDTLDIIVAGTTVVAGLMEVFIFGFHEDEVK